MIHFKGKRLGCTLIINYSFLNAINPTDINEITGTDWKKREAGLWKVSIRLDELIKSLEIN